MCTTFIVGDKATVDGSFLVARSADSSALKAQLFIIHPACYYPEGAMYRTKDHNGATDFSYPQCVTPRFPTGRQNFTAPSALTKPASA